jgi:hypothetical protein
MYEYIKNKVHRKRHARKQNDHIDMKKVRKMELVAIATLNFDLTYCLGHLFCDQVKMKHNQDVLSSHTIDLHTKSSFLPISLTPSLTPLLPRQLQAFVIITM